MKAAILFFGCVVLLCVASYAAAPAFSTQRPREEFAALGSMPTINGSEMVGSGAAANITIFIDSYSTDDEGRVMVAAFAKGQHKALRSALHKAALKGRIAIEGRDGFYELKLIRSTPTNNGRKIYALGERAIKFLDAYYSGRSHLEEFGILQLELTNNNGTEEGSGVLIYKSEIKSLNLNSIVLDDHGIHPVRLTVRRQ